MTVIIVKCAVTHSCGTDVALPALAAAETAGVSGCVTERSVHGTVTDASLSQTGYGQSQLSRS